MILNKSLLLKCLGGVAACTGIGGMGILGSQSGLLDNLFSKENDDSGNKNNQLQDNTKLTEKAGLDCDDSTKECTLKTNSKINVKHDQTKEEGKSFTSSISGSGKIKLQTENNTEENPKLVIEGGDISLTGDGTQITKLEQFETYEIEEEGSEPNKKYFLSRKTKAADGIRKELGLPDTCTLPETTSAPSSTPTCTINTTDIKKVKFEGVSNGQTVTSTGEVTLTITKLSSSDSDFPFDYKFSFKGKSAEVTLNLGNSNTITLKNTEATEFRIKKSTGNNITLEKAWTKETLTGKVGLSCNNNNECTFNGSLKVKQNDKKDESKTKNSSNTGTGKIKLYTADAEGYENNFKFVIEDGDINLTGGTESSITKLEQFETYEIKKDESGSDKKWYLTRKTKAAEGIKTALNLPNDCTVAESSNQECTDLDEAKLKAINFEGKTQNQEITVSGTATLTVSKETSTEDFPYGYKFTFKGKDADASLTIDSKQITLKQNEGTEFRIKKGASGNTITLEEAWSLTRLLEKVGLSGCTTENSTECSISGGGLKVKQEGESGEEGKTKQTGSSGKIKVYKENTTTDYNHGFKFVIEEGDINFGSSSGSISKLEQFETYEIKKESDKWYLTRKSKAADEIKKLLGLPTDNCNLPSGESESSTCCDLDETKLKAINFDGKDSTGATITTNGKVNLTITKTSDTANYPLGYKLSFDPTETVTISSASSIKIMKKTNTEFKIKVTQSSGATPVKLSLEKAWTVTELGKKVGLSCGDSSGDKKCSFTDGSINVKNGESNSTIEGAKVKTAGSGDKKITYQEDQEGYNQGIKFTVDGGECIELTKDGSDGSSTLNIENSSASYEIKEDTTDKKWYLTKYTSSQ